MSERTIRLHVERLPEGVYLVTSPDLPELLAQGRTIAETVEIAQDVARELAESYIEHGDPLPESVEEPLHFDLVTPVSAA
ncbi:type II toxin-antitoxin system HicB family antitoxin [bacterium]|nr:type II toxin-antitoxin system HicB family antitoxin [bacterium]